MPRPRYLNLPEDKRRGLLDAAGRELAARGYEGASLNAVLAATGISKGAFYYYFDDKADLFATVVEEIDAAQERVAPLAPDVLTRANYWPRLRERVGLAFAELDACPWPVDLDRAFHAIPMHLRTGRLAELHERSQTILLGFIERGRALGVIRGDLPTSLLLALLLGADRAFGEWLPANLSALGEDERRTLERASFDVVVRMMTDAATGEAALATLDATPGGPAGLLGESWMGSHFTNDDLMRESSYEDDWGRARRDREAPR